jgi:hypothetical protein
MALAYCILCHHSPGAVADLFRHIWRPDHHYILHADRKSAPAVHETVARLARAFPNVHALPSGLCSWGGWSLVAATLRGIDHACALTGHWSHFVLLSESHVPLVSPEAAAAALRPGVSYIEAGPVARMNRDGRADVMHRFAARYHEVPGVGMFATTPQALPPAFLATLHHGGQWIVLARDACERLRARLHDAALWEPFRTSLLADETALQTVLLGTEAGKGLTIERRATTFVGWPSLGGNADTTFTEQNFHEQAKGFLFIRKRPKELPPSVARALAPMRMQEPLPALPEATDSFTGGAPVSALAALLRQALQPRYPCIDVSALLPLRTGGSPSCFLQVRWPGLPQPLGVALLSEDLAQFKVMLAWMRETGNIFTTGTLGGYPTSLIRARLWDLFLTREVVLPDLPGGGFVSMSQGAPLDRLLRPIAHALDAGAALAPALAA